MTAAVDHVLILCSAGGEVEAQALRQLGLREGSPNTHPGQGTACRRFFFPDAYLELAWVEDAGEAQSPLARPTRLYDRWAGRAGTACPYGIILRPAGEGEPTAPFVTWSYRPSYLPEGMSIELARDTPIECPELFFLSFQRGRARGGQEPTDHAIPLAGLRGVTVWRPPAGRCEAARALEASGLVAFRDAGHYLVEMRFGEGTTGEADLRPVLPLGLRW